MPESISEGQFANLVMIAHSPEEFVIDFCLFLPAMKAARVKSRIILTPHHAKRMLQALTENMGHYEDRYGILGDHREAKHFYFGRSRAGEA